MKRKILIILAFGIVLSLLGFWSYPKIDQFFKVDCCLDSGGRWNYEKQECEFNDSTEVSEQNSLSGYNQLADEQNKKHYTISEFNTDLENNENIKRPSKSKFIDPIIDTSKLFKIWTLDPSGPHADFWIRNTDFYIVDYDGDGAMPFILNQDSLTIYFNDFIQKGKIILVNNDTLKIQWNDTDVPTDYVEWKN